MWKSLKEIKVLEGSLADSPNKKKKTKETVHTQEEKDKMLSFVDNLEYKLIQSKISFVESIKEISQINIQVRLSNSVQKWLKDLFKEMLK